MKLSSSRLFDDSLEIFWEEWLDKFIQALNAHFYKGMNKEFRLYKENEGRRITTTTIDWEEKVFDSFHDVEEYLLEEYIHAEDVQRPNFSNMKNTSHNDRRENIIAIMKSIMTLAFQDIEKPNLLMEKVCEKYKQEVRDIVKQNRERILSLSDRERYSDEELTRAEEHLWAPNVDILYQLIRASEEVIDIEKLCSSKISSIATFVNEVWINGILEALKSTKTFEEIISDRDYRWPQLHGNMNLLSHIE